MTPDEPIDEAREQYVQGGDDVTLEVLAERFRGRKGCSLSSLKRASSSCEWPEHRADWREMVSRFARGHLVLDPETGHPALGPSCPEGEREEIRAIYVPGREPASLYDYDRFPGIPRHIVEEATREVVIEEFGEEAWQQLVDDIAEMGTVEHLARRRARFARAAAQARALQQGAAAGGDR